MGLLYFYLTSRAQPLCTERGIRLYLTIEFSVKNVPCCPVGFTSSDVTSLQVEFCQGGPVGGPVYF
jgi:hypothetical protein